MQYSKNAPFEAGAPFVGSDLDQLGSAGSWLKNAVKDVGKAAKKGLKVALPVAKLAGTALAFVVPPAGIGILAAAEGADRLIAAAEAGGKMAKTASKAYQATKQLAAKGDSDARRALQALQVQATQRKLAAVPKGQPHPKLGGAQLKRDRGKLQRAVSLKPKGTITTTGTAAPASTATEAGFFVTMKGRIHPGKMPLKV